MHPSVTERRSTLAGAGFMLLGMFMAATLDMAVKGLTASHHTPQIVLLRTAFAVPLVLAFCHFQGGIRSILTPRWGWQLYRGALTAGANFGFFYGLAYVPLLTAVMLAYLSPALIVLLSRPLLGERLAGGQWAGVVIGFAGVMVILGPRDLAFSGGMLAVLGSTLCWALLSISNRQLAGRETAAALTFYTMPVSGLLAAWLTWGQWVPPSLTDWLLFATIGICGGSLHMCVATAYRLARAGAIAPLEYTNLVWAGLGAYLIWDEIPAPLSWAGGAAVLAGGFLALRSR